MKMNFSGNVMRRLALFSKEWRPSEEQNAQSKQAKKQTKSLSNLFYSKSKNKLNAFDDCEKSKKIFMFEGLFE
jgi:hypothetical protein